MREEDIKILLGTPRRPEELSIPLFYANADYTPIVDTHLPTFAKSLSKEALNNDYDVIITHQDGPTVALSTLIGQLSNTPVIIRLGGNPWETHQTKAVEALFERDFPEVLKRVSLLVENGLSFRLASGYLTVSEALVDTAIKHTNINEAAVRSVPLPIKKPELFDIPVGLSSNTVGLLTVTNLEFKAKFDSIVDILNKIVSVLKQHPNTTYSVVGGGRYLIKLETLVNERYPQLAAESRIRILGYVDSIYEVLEQSDIFVYFSGNDGYPNAVLEAKCAGLPVVANPRFGMQEQVADGTTGRLISASNGEALITSLKELVDSASLRHELGRQAREDAKQTNNPAVIGQQLVAETKGIISISSN